MKRELVLPLVASVAMFGVAAWGSSARQDARERLQNSAEVLTEIAASPDKGIPNEVVQRARCIIVVPHLVKAGLIAGGKYGRGVAVCRTNSGKHAGAKTAWSAPAFITIGGASWGLQIGAEGIDLVMMVMNDKGFQQLMSNKVQATAEGSITAGPVGRHASVGSDWKQDADVLTYSRVKGVFAGQTLEGAVIEQDADSTTAFYGSDIPSNKILSGSVPAPDEAAPFLKAVAEISHQAATREAKKQTSQNDAMESRRVP